MVKRFSLFNNESWKQYLEYLGLPFISESSYDFRYSEWYKANSDALENLAISEVERCFSDYLRGFVVGNSFVFPSGKTHRQCFADNKHKTDYDQKYEEYRASLGEEVEPEPIDFRKTDLSVTLSSAFVEPHSVFELVGHGKITNKKCGSFLRLDSCLELHKHNIVTLSGGNFKGKVPVHYVYSHCDKPSCPICSKRGWACREAEKITAKLEKAASGWTDEYGIKHAPMGVIEHATVSVPSKDFGLSYEQLKAKAIKVAKSRGLIGGVLIFHPYRYRKSDIIQGGVRNMSGWYIAPHFHYLGFVLGGYSMCRNCSKMKPYYYKTRSGRVVKKIGNDTVCFGCSGFEARVRLLAWGDLDVATGKHTGFYSVPFFNKKGEKRFRRVAGDQWVVRVFDARQSIFGTAWYQLNHAGLVKGKKRFYPETWMGLCSYRRLQLSKESFKEYKRNLCPICGSPMREVIYTGKALFEGFEAFSTLDKIVDLWEFDEDGHLFKAFEYATEKPKG